MKKNWALLDYPSESPAAINHVLLTAKESAIRDAVAALKPINTFAAIGAQVGYSRQYVSKHMQERFRGDTAAMWKIGDDWRIPQKTAEIWIREMYA